MTIISGSDMKGGEYHMTYSQIGKGFATRPNYCIQSKEVRLKSYGGYIFADYDENMPMEVKTCAQVAVDIWESEINAATPIRIRFDYAALPEIEQGDGDYVGQFIKLTTADVRFILNQDDNLSYPTSLYRQTHDLDEDYDAVITINNDFHLWDFSHANKVSLFGDYNLTTALLQSIGNALGIASSIDYSSTLPTLGLPGLTPYDTLIEFHDGQAVSTLSDLNLQTGEPSEALAAMLDKDTYIISSEDRRIPLSNGNLFGEPGINHADYYQDTLYSSLISSRTKFQKIDPTTADILERIGWNRDKPKAGIYESSETGIVYDNFLKFYDTDCPLESGSAFPAFTINYRRKDGSWLEKDGYAPQWPGGAQTGFSLPSAEEQKGLEINVNGDIYGYVHGSITIKDWVNHIDYGPHPVKYRASIELAPQILDATLHHIDGDISQPVLLVTFRGADHILATITADDGSLDETFTTADSYVACLSLHSLSTATDHTVRLVVSNGNGMDVKEVRITSANLSGIGQPTATEIVPDRMEVYDLNGRLVAHDTDTLSKGVYILLLYNGETLLRREKIAR